MACVTFAVTTTGFVYLRHRVYSQAAGSAVLLRDVETTEEKKKRELDVKNVYSMFTDERMRITTFVVSKEKAVTFIEAVEKIGTDTSTEVEISGLSTIEIVKTNKIKDNFTSLRTHLEVKGKWSNVMRAFTLIENMPYSISIDTIYLSEVSDTAQPEPVGTSTSPAVSPKIWKLTLDIKILSLD